MGKTKPKYRHTPPGEVFELFGPALINSVAAAIHRSDDAHLVKEANHWCHAVEALAAVVEWALERDEIHNAQVQQLQDEVNTSADTIRYLNQDVADLTKQRDALVKTGRHPTSTF
jgi:gamma-glutamyl phosphate reductase